MTVLRSSARREYADPSRKSEILVVGMGKFVELWNRERYEDLDGDESISELAEQLNRSRRS